MLHLFFPRLPVEDIFSSQRQLARCSSPDGFVSGFASGIKNLGQSVVGGLVNVVSVPVRSAKEGGIKGFFKGVGLGLVGAAAKPVTGVLDLVSQTSQGMARSAKSFFASVFHECNISCFFQDSKNKSWKTGLL